MKKKILLVMLIVVLIGVNIVSASATEINASSEVTEDVNLTETEEEKKGAVINPDNYVSVDEIDLSLHVETTGEFTPVYMYDNPFMGKDTSQGVVIEFYAKPTWEVHELGAIFAINGKEDYDGKLYFSPGSYLGFNSTNFGGYFDANLYSYKIVTDYIKDGASIRIELMPDGFDVYANDVFCYDQTILDNPQAGAGDYTSESDFSQVLDWLKGADTLYFGYGSWWNEMGSNEANINLSQISFRLMDGTVLMDKLEVDKELIESLGGSVDLKISDKNSSDLIFKIEDVNVEVFDINSVEYEAGSVIVPVAIMVILVQVLAVIIIVIALKKHEYDDV